MGLSFDKNNSLSAVGFQVCSFSSSQVSDVICSRSNLLNTLVPHCPMRSKTNNQVECNKTRARSSKEHWSSGLSFQSHFEWLYQGSWSSLSSQTNHKLIAATHSSSILPLCFLADQNCLKNRKIFALRGHNGIQDELSCFQSFPLSSLTIYFTSGLWVPELSYLPQSWDP